MSEDDQKNLLPDGGLEQPPSPRFIVNVLFIPIVLAIICHVGGRAGYRYGYYGMEVSDSLTLLALALILGAAITLLYRVYRISLVTYIAVSSASMILMGQFINLFTGSPIFGGVAAVTGPTILVTIKELLFVGGVTLLIGGFLIVIHESHKARIALARAYTGIEEKIRQRTETLTIMKDELETEIAERRRTELALRESEAKFRALVENTQDAILRIDRYGQIIYANPCAKRHFQELTVSGFLSAYHLYNDNAWRTGLADVIETHLVGRLELVEDDGERRRVLDWILIPELNHAQEVTTVLLVARDMTPLYIKELERQTLQTQLIQAQKLESVGHLAGGVAHDFNNLLQVICGHLELAMTALDTTNPIHSRLTQVQRAADRATRLVRQLLLFSRKETMHRERLSINNLVADLAKMLGRVIGEQYQFEITYANNVPDIFADANHMEQVLMNLCVNARDAMPGGGIIRIRTSRETVGTGESTVRHPEARPGEYALLSLADTGIGISRHHLEHIFDPFFTTKEVGKGTGLGLAMVYGIVQQHSGFIMVDSMEGVGSTFRIYLPACEEGHVQEASQHIPVIADRGRGECILIAEDDLQVRQLNVSILRSAGYNVLEAGDGIEAIDIALHEDSGVQLCLFDVMMPRMTGWGAFQKIRFYHPQMPGIFFSGYSYDTLTHVNLPQEGVTLLQKPVASQVLLAKVREMLDNITV